MLFKSFFPASYFVTFQRASGRACAVVAGVSYNTQVFASLAHIGGERSKNLFPR